MIIVGCAVLVAVLKWPQCRAVLVAVLMCSHTDVLVAALKWSQCRAVLVAVLMCSHSAVLVAVLKCSYSDPLLLCRFGSRADVLTQ